MKITWSLLALIAPTLAYRHYVVLSPSMTRTEAEEACETHGWKLANIDGMKHAEMILLESGITGGWVASIKGNQERKNRAWLLKKTGSHHITTVASIPIDEGDFFKASAICEAEIDSTSDATRIIQPSLPIEGVSKKTRTVKAASKALSLGAPVHGTGLAEPKHSKRTKSEKSSKKDSLGGIVPKEYHGILSTFGGLSTADHSKLLKQINGDLVQDKRKKRNERNKRDKCKYRKECKDRSKRKRCSRVNASSKSSSSSSPSSSSSSYSKLPLEEGKRRRKHKKGVDLQAIQRIVEQNSSSSSSSDSVAELVSGPKSRSQRRRVIKTKKTGEKDPGSLKQKTTKKAPKKASKSSLHNPVAKKQATRKGARNQLSQSLSISRSSSSLSDTLSYSSWAEQIYASSSDGPAAIFRNRRLHRHIHHSSSSTSFSIEVPILSAIGPITPLAATPTVSTAPVPLTTDSVRGQLGNISARLSIASKQADLEALRAKRQVKVQARRQERQDRTARRKTRQAQKAAAKKARTAINETNKPVGEPKKTENEPKKTEKEPKNTAVSSLQD